MGWDLIDVKIVYDMHPYGYADTIQILAEPQRSGNCVRGIQDGPVLGGFESERK